MRYISTRGRAPVLDFTDVTLAGLASDGGLYVPEEFSSISAMDLEALASMPYAVIAEKIMQPYVGSAIPNDDLRTLIAKSYSVFFHPDIVPLKKLGDYLYVLELTHGPTLAFKDVALQFLGHVFDYILKKKNQRVTIVGATSGDTGSAAIEAFKDRDNADIFILHPHGRVSEVQRRQMTTVLSPNVHNIAVEGSFDDCQDLVKAMFADEVFRADMNLSAVNSINWARILAQIVYYVYAAARVHHQTERAPAFCVPTGNFGNVYAGYVARRMGAPINRLLVATNSNDILHRFFATGQMKTEKVTPTISPSMDIQVSSNFERLLFDLFGRAGSAVDKTMKHFRTAGPFHVEKPAMDYLGQMFSSGRLNDDETRAVIRRIYDRYGYIIDPHTAVGVGVAEAYQKNNLSAVVVSLATAHPAKFPDAVEAAIGIRPPLPAHLADLYQRKERCAVLPSRLDRVMDFVRANTRR